MDVKQEKSKNYQYILSIEQVDAWQDFVNIKNVQREMIGIKTLLESSAFYPITFTEPMRWVTSASTAANTQHWILVNACQLAICGYNEKKIVRLFEKQGINIFRNTQYGLPGVSRDSLSAELLAPLIVLGQIESVTNTIAPQDGRRATVKVKVLEVLKGDISPQSTVEIRIYSGRAPNGEGVIWNFLDDNVNISPEEKAIFYLSHEGYEFRSLYPRVQPYPPYHKESYKKPDLPLENQFYDIDYPIERVYNDDRTQKRIEQIKRIKNIVKQLD